MRNSVKVVIDAYDGTVDAYIADPNDPVVQTYAQIFGGIFKPLSAMPADVRRHLRYPGDLFRLQTALYATYHMVEPDAFYHREDQWQYPGVEKGTPNVNPFMRHIIMRLPGEKNPEFIFMTPFTPRGKDNLAAWMVARMDGENYGKLSVYRFPKQSLVYGPKQIANRINQDTDISRQLTLWDQKGLAGDSRRAARDSDRGVSDLRAADLPARRGRHHSGAEARGRRAREPSGDGRDARGRPQRAVRRVHRRGAVPAMRADLLRQAQEHYDRAIAAQRAGNWAEYGREIEQLGAVLRQLRAGRP